VIAALDRDNDGVISIVEFKRALTPKCAKNIPKHYGLSFDQTFLYKQSWLRALAELLIAIA